MNRSFSLQSFLYSETEEDPHHSRNGIWGVKAIENGLAPTDETSLECQMDHLRNVYSALDLRNAPLLPPYDGRELVALEVHYSFVFPPILRWYLLNISREVTFEDYRTVIAPYDCKIERITARSRQAIVPRRRRGLGYVFEDDKWTEITSAVECTENWRETIWLSGPNRGYVTVDHHGSLDNLIYSSKITFTRCRTIFDRLSHPFVPTSEPPRTATLASINRWQLAVSAVDTDLPDSLKTFPCSYNAQACDAAMTYSKIQNIVERLEPSAVKIQRAFRLWRWRKDVVWNPHTDAGSLNLAIQARLVLRE